MIKKTIDETRRGLASLAGRVAYHGERVVITKHGRAVMALVSLDDLRRIDGEEARMDAEDVAEIERMRGTRDMEEHISWEDLRAQEGLAVSATASSSPAKRRKSSKPSRRR